MAQFACGAQNQLLPYQSKPLFRQQDACHDFSRDAGPIPGVLVHRDHTCMVLHSCEGPARQRCPDGRVFIRGWLPLHQPNATSSTPTMTSFQIATCDP